MKKEYTTEMFIQKAYQTHGDLFTYERSFYVKATIPITITCRIHGDFTQTPNNHLRGQGCPVCGDILRRSKRRIGREEFIRRCNEVHGDQYDYTNIDYRIIDTTILVRCFIHGEFEVTAGNHLYGKNGCPDCRRLKIGNLFRMSFTEFRKRARRIHGDRISFENVRYVNARTKIELTCKKHGSFWTVPYSILKGRGCQKCGGSLGESYVRRFLLKEQILFKEQKMFETCRFINKLKFDFFLPEYKAAIEYDGIQHFPDEIPNTNFRPEWIQTFGILKDMIKTEWCRDNGIALLRIKYDECAEDKLKVFFESLLDREMDEWLKSQ